IMVDARTFSQTFQPLFAQRCQPSARGVAHFPQISLGASPYHRCSFRPLIRRTHVCHPMSESPEPSLGASPRFDWWQALIRVLSSVEAVRDGRGMYLLLGTFSAAGLLAASAQASFGRGAMNWAIGEGAAALFVAFYGASAAGLVLMDRAMGLPPRELRDAVRDALGIGHRMLVALAVMALAISAVGAVLLGLYWLCALPKVGPWLFGLVVPTTVVVLGLVSMAGLAVVAPLTGPTVWAGASSWQAVRTLFHLIRDRLVQAGVLVAALSLATAL